MQPPIGTPRAPLTVLNTFGSNAPVAVVPRTTVMLPTATATPVVSYGYAGFDPDPNSNANRYKSLVSSFPFVRGCVCVSVGVQLLWFNFFSIADQESMEHWTERRVRSALPSLHCPLQG